MNRHAIVPEEVPSNPMTSVPQHLAHTVIGMHIAHSNSVENAIATMQSRPRKKPSFRGSTRNTRPCKSGI